MSVAHFVVIQVGVYEHELNQLGENSRDWPDAIRRLIERELNGWRARNPTRTITQTRSFVLERQCNVEFFHIDKSEIPPASARESERQSADGSPVPPQQMLPSSPAAAPALCTRCTD